MGLLNQLFSRMFDAAAGRIHWYSNMWALVGSRWDRNRLVNKNLIGSARVNEKGEWNPVNGVSLVKRLCVSNCPNPPGEDFHKRGNADKYWVPATECRKCPYHRKADRQFRFPRCTFEKETERGLVETKAANQFAGLLGEAEAKANQLLNQ